VGNFYKNVTLFGPPRDAVLAALAGHERTAYVSPTRRRFTVVYDRDSDEAGGPDALGDLSMTLSADLACPALAAAVYDDDVLLLGLYDRGRQIGEYNSSGTSTLTAASLAGAFDAAPRTAIVAALLALPRWPLFLFESTRHRLIAGALGMPPWARATGYRYIAQDEPPPGLTESDLEHVGRGPSRR